MLSKYVILGLCLTVSTAYAKQVDRIDPGSFQTGEMHTYETESAKLIGGAFKVVDSKASGGFTVSLTNQGNGIKFSNLKAARKLAIHYASVKVGAISVAVNDLPTGRD